MIKTSDYLVQKLEALGVDTAFMVSGGGAMHLDDSFGKSQKIRLICNHNEQASAMCAEGYARANQKLGVACVTTGPGGLNCLNGVFGSWTDSAPVLFISGQVKFTTTMASCPQIPLRQLGDQEVNIISVVRPLTKYARMVTDPYDIDAAVEEAVYLATSGRPGPVWLDIPLNVQAAPIDPAKLKKFIRPALHKQDISGLLDQAAALLQQARRPLIVAGNGIHCAKAQLAGAEYLEQQAFIDASSRLWQLYEEAARLHASIEEYQETFARQRDLTLLRKALDGGEISLIEYFVEVSVVYQSQQNLLQLENQYQKTMAQIFKSQL